MNIIKKIKPRERAVVKWEKIDNIQVSIIIFMSKERGKKKKLKGILGMIKGVRINRNGVFENI